MNLFFIFLSYFLGLGKSRLEFIDKRSVSLDSTQLKSLSFYSEYTKSKSEGCIEDGIIPLSDALFNLNFLPLASCEGHYFEEYEHPYVLFSCPKNEVGFLNIELLFQVFANHPSWYVEGFSQADGHLLWAVRPNPDNIFIIEDSGVEIFDRELFNSETKTIINAIQKKFK